MGAGVAGVSVLLQLPVTGWVDITDYVHISDGRGISIEAGCQDESTTIGQARCSLVLDNADGRFSIDNIDGAWWGEIALGLVLRVTTTPEDGDSHDRFWGKIVNLSPAHDQTGTIRQASLTAAGESHFLELSKPVPSPYKMMVVYGTPPVAYWSLEGEVASAAYAPTVGAYSAAVSGTVTPAGSTEIPGSQALPVISDTGTLMARVGSYASTTHTAYRQVAIFYSLPSSAFPVFRLSMTGGTVAEWTLWVNNVASSQVKAYDYHGTELLSDPLELTSLVGYPTQAWIELTQNGADIDWEYGVNHLLPDGSILAESVSSATLSGHTMGKVATITIGPVAVADGFAVGHMALGTDLSVASSAEAMSGYLRETALTRLDRVADAAGITANSVAVGSGFEEILGQQQPGTFADLFQDIADSDGGIMADATSELAIDYIPRHALQYGEVKMTLDVASGHVRLPPELTYDDKDAVRAAEVSEAQYESTINTFGKSVSSSMNLATATQAQAAAEWEVHLGEGKKTRLSSVAIDLATNDSLRAAWLSMYPGDRVQITNAPSDYPKGDLDFILRGWTEFISYTDWEVHLNMPSADPWKVGILEGLGGLLDDTEDGSTINGLHDSVDTTLLITTVPPAGSAHGMATTGVPFDMLAATGELFTVTAVTENSSSSYTLTVTRSVNGVAKSLPNGTAIRLANPFLLAR